MGLSARQWTLVEHFAEQKTWNGLAYCVEMFESCTGVGPAVQVWRLDLAVLLSPLQARWPILDLGACKSLIGQGDQPDCFWGERRPSSRCGILPFVPIRSAF